MNLVKERTSLYPSSGERNFQVENVSAAIDRVFAAYRAKAISFDNTDGMSLDFSDWRFNLRASNTEPLVRLNIESREDSRGIEDKVSDISKILDGRIA